MSSLVNRGCIMKLYINNVKLYYEVYGKGPSLIMLHGNGETHNIFDKAINILKDYFTIYAIDTRGHGNSSKIDDYHYDDMVEDMYQFITQLEIDKPIVYGFSDGGIIGLLLASKYPTLLSRLIVSGANTSPNGLKNILKKFYEVVNFFVKDNKVIMMLNEPDISASMLNKINIPTLILAGSNDIIKRSDTEFMADNIVDSKVKIIKHKGHGNYIVHKKDIAFIIIDFCMN